MRNKKTKAQEVSDLLRRKARDEEQRKNLSRGSRHIPRKSRANDRVEREKDDNGA